MKKRFAARTSTVLLAIALSSIVAFSQPATAAKQAEATKPFVLGVVEEFRSVMLKEIRTLNIYLPAGYNESDSVRYPIIYLLDGSANEDFVHVVGLVQYNNLRWVNRIPKSIVVGIANVDRRRDFTFPTAVESDKVKLGLTGRSERFIAFIERELQPFVDKKYRTTQSRTLIGQSLGGLLATEILFKKPELFEKYIIISPSLWWDDGSIFKLKPELLNENFTRKTDVYVGVGKEGFAPSKIPRVMEEDAKKLAETIKSARNNNVTVHFDYLPQEDHATVTHQAVFNAFRLLYPVPVN